MKRLGVVFLFLICTLIGATVLQSMHPAQLSQASTEKDNLPISVVEVQAQKTIVPTEATALNFGSFETPLVGVTQIEAVLVELLDRNEALIHQPGWLHFQYSSYSAAEKEKRLNHDYKGTSLADMFSEKQEQQEWMHVINNNGEFLEYFILSRDNNGNELQKLVAGPDGKGGNLTLLKKGIKNVGEEPDDGVIAEANSQTVGVMSQVENVLADLKEFQRANAQIRGWQEQKDGQDVFILQIDFENEKPIIVPEYSEPIVGSSIKYVFNWTNGQLQTCEFWTHLQEGEKILESAYSYDIVEVLPVLPDKVEKEYQKSLNELSKLLENKP